MAGPWEQYGGGSDGPWAAYAAPKQAMSAGETSVDVAKSGGVGLGKGGIGLLGLPGDLAELGARGIDRATRFVSSKFGVDAPVREDRPPTYGSADITKAVKGVTGEFYKPKTLSGEYASTVGEFGAGLIGGGGVGALGRRAVTQVVAPGLASEAAGQATKDTAYEPYARVAGALVGGLAPSLAGRIVSPMPINAERAGAVQTLRNEGVTDLTAGQVTGRKPLQYLEAERGRGANLMESQAEQFTGAALRRVGENAPRATPEVIDRAFTRIGGEFDRLAANNTATVDNVFAQNLRNAVDDYHNLVAPPNRAPVIENFVTEIRNTAQRNGGVLPGDVYQSLRSRMERAARGMGNNPEARTAIREMRESVDDAMERSIVATGNTADIAAWREARNQYRNMLVIEKAATGAGEGAAAGLISPAKLREATVNTQGRRNYARGDGDFSDLARAGVQTMSPLPNSGTAGRMSAQNLGVGVSTLLGGAAGGAAGGGDPTATIAGILAGAVLPRAVGRAATTNVGRAYLGNQTAAPMLNNLTPGQSAVTDALLAAQQQRLELQR
jgi:hypothetical protein